MVSQQKKGLVLQRGLEGILEPCGYEKIRGDNLWILPLGSSVTPAAVINVQSLSIREIPGPA